MYSFIFCKGEQGNRAIAGGGKRVQVFGFGFWMGEMTGCLCMDTNDSDEREQLTAGAMFLKGWDPGHRWSDWLQTAEITYD